jgi:hypothetical protein
MHSGGCLSLEAAMAAAFRPIAAFAILIINDYQEKHTLLPHLTACPPLFGAMSDLCPAAAAAAPIVTEHGQPVVNVVVSAEEGWELFAACS